jgi:hypothetical protein
MYTTRNNQILILSEYFIMNEAIAKYYRQFSSAPVKNKALRQHELYNLYKRPKLDKGLQEAHFNITEPNEIYQADLLYLPDDHGYKYALVVVDPATGITDVQPLKERSSEAVLEGFKELFARKILPLPKTQIQVDSGSEFRGATEKYFNDKGIGVRYAKTARSRQTPFAEARNKAIGKAVHQRQTAEQLLTNDISRDWVADVPHFVEAINDFVKTKPKKRLTGDPMINKESDPILQIGTPVRVALDKPIESTGQRLSGKFRASDIRYDPDNERILNTIISPDEPVLYKVSGKSNLGTAYTYNQLQVIPENEQPPPSSVIRGTHSQYIIWKILDKKKEGNKTLYKVAWKGFSESDADTTWLPTSSFKTKALKDMLKRFNDSH